MVINTLRITTTGFTAIIVSASVPVFTLIFCPHRFKITVEELARRVGPPEYMSFSSLVAYLRADNNTRKELQAQLEDVGIKPSDLTTRITLFSRLLSS